MERISIVAMFAALQHSGLPLGALSPAGSRWDAQSSGHLKRHGGGPSLPSVKPAYAQVGCVLPAAHCCTSAAAIAHSKPLPAPAPASQQK
eukprot:363362-Chlamydomonas_euryale.AAC.18